MTSRLSVLAPHVHAKPSACVGSLKLQCSNTSARQCTVSRTSQQSRCSHPSSSSASTAAHCTHPLRGALLRTAAARSDLPDVSDVEVAEEYFPPLSTARFVRGRSAFAEEFRIMGHESGPDQRATVVTVANLLQEVAGNHAVAMWGRSQKGFASLPSMKNFIFVMTRLHIKIDRFPQWGDLVEAETWFMEESRLSCRRDTALRHAPSGEFLAGATSQWVVINTSTRRIGKLPEELRTKFMALAADPPRYAVPKEEAKRRVPDLPEAVVPLPDISVGPGMFLNGSEMEEDGVVRRFHLTRRGDIDMNGHVNNVAYLQWALDTLPDHILDDYQLTELELEFKAECNAGDVVESILLPFPEDAGVPTPLANGDTVHYLHHLFMHPANRGELPPSSKASRPQELVRARTSWKPRA